jgi:hypothetical protein
MTTLDLSGSQRNRLEWAASLVPPLERVRFLEMTCAERLSGTQAPSDQALAVAVLWSLGRFNVQVGVGLFASAFAPQQKVTSHA